MEKTKRRIEWIDVVKCICILFIMLGHFSFIPDRIATFWSPFCLTAFLFCSGYTFHLEKDYGTFLKKRFFQIIIPMLWMGAIIILSRLILTFNEHISIWAEIKNFFIQIRGNGDEMWFLALMFGTDLFFYLIVLTLKEKKIIIFATFMLFILSYIYSVKINIPLPWHIQMYGSACFFMALGYAFKGKAEKIFDKYNSLILFAISFIIFLVLWLKFVIFGTYQPVSFYNFGNDLFYYFAQILSSLIALISVSKLFKYPKFILYMGQNTLILYGLHGKLESLYEKGIGDFIVKDNIISQFTFGIVGVIIISMLLMVICYIINKYLPFLIGRENEVKNNGKNIIHSFFLG